MKITIETDIASWPVPGLLHILREKLGITRYEMLAASEATRNSNNPIDLSADDIDALESARSSVEDTHDYLRALTMAYATSRRLT